MVKLPCIMEAGRRGLGVAEASNTRNFFVPVLPLLLISGVVLQILLLVVFQYDFCCVLRPNTLIIAPLSTLQLRVDDARSRHSNASPRTSAGEQICLPRSIFIYGAAIVSRDTGAPLHNIPPLLHRSNSRRLAEDPPPRLVQAPPPSQLLLARSNLPRQFKRLHTTSSYETRRAKFHSNVSTKLSTT